MKILVTGATGGTGLAIVRELQARDYTVVVIVRDKAKAERLITGAVLLEGDVRDPAVVAKALQGCDAVISSLGTRRITFFEKVTLMSQATRTLVSEMNKQRVLRLVCITGVGAGDSNGHGGFLYDRIFKPILLGRIYQDKNRQEAIISSSDLHWVIVRPTRLTDKPASGRIRAITNLNGFHGGQISRSDVATFVVAQVSDDRWLRKTPLITWE